MTRSIHLLPICGLIICITASINCALEWAGSYELKTVQSRADRHYYQPIHEAPSFRRAIRVYHGPGSYFGTTRILKLSDRWWIRLVTNRGACIVRVDERMQAGYYIDPVKHAVKGFGIEKYCVPTGGSYALLSRQIEVPFWFILICTLVYPLMLAWSGVKRRGRNRAGLCRHCGYDLTGNVSGVCSECGTQLTTSPSAVP